MRECHWDEPQTGDKGRHVRGTSDSSAGRSEFLRGTRCKRHYLHPSQVLNPSQVLIEEEVRLPLVSQRNLVVFQLADQTVALPLENIQRITSMAQLARPPGLPSLLEGVLNLAGGAVPILRLERLFQLATRPAGLYSMLMILKDISAGPLGILVDRVNEVLSVPGSSLIRVSGEDMFNGCTEATIAVRGQAIHLLSPTRILLEKERELLSEFRAIAQQRLQDWEAGRP
jgi:purine-binding chemotaxis protein CheW